jgi:hypothetical protein
MTAETVGERTGVTGERSKTEASYNSHEFNTGKCTKIVDRDKIDSVVSRLKEEEVGRL